MFIVIKTVESRLLIATMKPRRAFCLHMNFFQYFFSIYSTDVSRLPCSNSCVVIIINNHYYFSKCISILHWTHVSVLISLNITVYCVCILSLVYIPFFLSFFHLGTISTRCVVKQGARKEIKPRIESQPEPETCLRSFSVYI